MENVEIAPIELCESVELYEPEGDSFAELDEITELKLAHIAEITKLKLAHVYEKRDLKLAHLDEITELKLAHNDEKIKMCDESIEKISKLEENMKYFYKKYMEADEKCTRWASIATVGWAFVVLSILIHFFVCF